MHLKPVLAKSQQFLQHHQRETLLVSRCITGILGLVLITILGLLLYAYFVG